MNKLDKGHDAFFRKWRWSPDRAQNEVSLGSFGLRAAISRIGEVSFSIRMRVGGERKCKVLGYFRDEGFRHEDAIVAAQKQRADWRAEARGEVRHLAIEEVPKFSELLELYPKACDEGDPIACPLGRGKPKHWDEYARLFPKVYAALMNKNLRTIKRENIWACHQQYLEQRQKVIGRKPNTTIRFAFNAAKPMFTYARDMHWLAPETLVGLRANVPKEKSRDRILLPREWQKIAPCLDQMADDKGLLIRYLLATACRLSMAINMQWRELRTVNVGTPEKPREITVWCVPGSKMKQGFLALFPIVGETQRLIDVLRAKAGGSPKPDDFVFPDVVRKAWQNNPDHWQKIIYSMSATKDWHRHDLRRTTASLLQYVGADMPTVCSLLAHRTEGERGATGGYLAINQQTKGLADLADKLLLVHRLLKDCEIGRASRDLKALYGELLTSPKVRGFMLQFELDPETDVEIVPSTLLSVVK